MFSAFRMFICLMLAAVLHAISYVLYVHIIVCLSKSEFPFGSFPSNGVQCRQRLMTRPSGHVSTSQATEQSFPRPHHLPHLERFQRHKVLHRSQDDDDGPWGGLTLSKCQHSKTMLLTVQFPSWTAPHSWALTVMADGKTHPGPCTECHVRVDLTCGPHMWGPCEGGEDGEGNWALCLQQLLRRGDSCHTGEAVSMALWENPTPQYLFSTPLSWVPEIPEGSIVVCQLHYLNKNKIIYMCG